MYSSSSSSSSTVPFCECFRICVSTYLALDLLLSLTEDTLMQMLHADADPQRLITFYQFTEQAYEHFNVPR